MQKEKPLYHFHKHLEVINTIPCWKEPTSKTNAAK